MAHTHFLVLAFSLALVEVSTLPVTMVTKADIVNKPASPGCSALYNTSKECVDDLCCNWCEESLAPPGSGFCMKTIPYAMPALTCAKDVTLCDDMTNEEACDADHKTSCVWMPLGANSTDKTGLCIYDWSSCKAPEKITSTCCNWCGTVWNASSPGFCMPRLDAPIPSMKCSKQGKSCSDFISPDACITDKVCSWIPFGPPGTPGPGICTFDWAKC
eukprot:CAMPEP_0180253202 /NCGR_PEP_ID=MMETSP0987-20121128/39464_1 /TAXON_ID=697907 /ORGANISM="non described non described, Strain CCMP2293" /LENGTH=215 /DNA_ID=CAMNT_0022222033 /DNA_START=73 /DNA_END=720 /DNA_ORIENTATION=+